MCDPSCIRRARADYYGVFMYYKNKAGKQVLKPKQGKVLKNGTKSPTKAGKSLNFVRPNPIRPVPGIRPIIKNGGTHFVGNGRLPAVRPPINGNYKKHYVDSMLLEADRAANKLRSMINDIRKSWSTNADRDEKTVVLATQKIREAFANSKVNLDTADKKVVDIYRLNMDEADIRDIEPVLEVKGSAEEAKIFAKSDVIDDIVIETVETVPDLPFPLDEEEEEVEEIKEEGAEDKIKQTEESKEDGILDMSIEELEEGEDPELKNKNEKEKTSTDDLEEINTSIPDPLEIDDENNKTEMEDSSEASTVPEKETDSKKSALGRLQIKSSEEDSFLVVEDKDAAEKDIDYPIDALADKAAPDEDIELAEEVTEDHKVNPEAESELNELIDKEDKKDVEENETIEEEMETNEDETETNKEKKDTNKDEKETNEDEKETGEEERETNEEEKETGVEENETNKEEKTEHPINEDEGKLNNEVKENGEESKECQEEERGDKSEDKAGVEAQPIKKIETEEEQSKESTNDDDKENENEHVKEN